MRITPKEGFRDFKNKKGDIIKSNGKPLRVQDFDGHYPRNDIINYLDGFIDKAKHRDPNVRYCVMLKFNNGEWSNGDIQPITERAHLQDVWYDEHEDNEICGFRIVILP